MGPMLPPVVTTGAKLMGGLKAIGAGALSFLGGEYHNRDQRRVMREQMRFQERMSSTAVQRAVADYTAAGLNPALAYERGASSPAGSTVALANTVEAGMGRAMAMKALQADLDLKRTQAAASAQLAGVYAEDIKKRQKETELTQRQIEALEHQIPELKAQGDWWRGLGDAGTAGKGLNMILQSLSTIFGRRK